MTKFTVARFMPLAVALITASRVSGYVVPKASLLSLRLGNSSASRITEPILGISKTPALRMAIDDETDSDKEASRDTTSDTNKKISSSKREMLKFAIPALGIFLANPLLSNIDNAFVGQTVGTEGLAALSPATICTDQMLYLFSYFIIFLIKIFGLFLCQSKGILNFV